MTVHFENRGPVAIITIDRPDVRNAVDQATANALAQVFRRFDADDSANVAVLTGAGGHFCAGADLKALAGGEVRNINFDGDAPMGCTRMLLDKPVIAAIEGYAVAGGIELAIWCDLRVVAEDAVMGVFCRRFGVPLIDLGTIRLPRLIGQSRAMDLLLTGRGVEGPEALQMGLANRVVPHGEALATAIELAELIAKHPQECMRNDRRSSLEQWSLTEAEAVRNELELGLRSIQSGETLKGAAAFRDGAGRHGGSR